MWSSGQSGNFSKDDLDTLDLLLWRTASEPLVPQTPSSPPLPRRWAINRSSLRSKGIRRLHRSEGSIYERKTSTKTLSRWDESYQHFERRHGIKAHCVRFYFPALCPRLLSAARSAHVSPSDLQAQTHPWCKRSYLIPSGSSPVVCSSCPSI